MDICIYLLTVFIPVLETLVASSNKLQRRRPEKGHHLREVLFIIQYAVFFCEEKISFFKEVPDLEQQS